MSINCDVQQITLSWNAIRSKRQASPSTELREQAHSKISASAGISNASDEQSAERELSRVISKSDFARMDVVGQFNRGFIIARRRTRDSLESLSMSAVDDLDDLFIIDQHAADEKYNFETLQQTTKIDSQKLFKYVLDKFDFEVGFVDH